MEKLKLKHRVPPAAVLLADSHSDLGAITDRNKQKALFHQYNFFLGPSPCQQSDCLIPTQDKYCLKIHVYHYCSYYIVVNLTNVELNEVYV